MNSTTPTTPATPQTPIARRDFAKLLGATGLLATTGVAALAARAASAARREAYKERSSAAPTKTNTLINATPAVYAPATDSATIIWTLNAPARGWVEYGTDPRNLTQRSGGDPFGFTPHDERILKVRLRALAPATRYYWRAAAVPLPPLAPGATMNALPPEPPPAYTPVYSFTTLAPDAPETHFAIWNDTHLDKDTLTRLAALTTGKNTVFPPGAPPAFLLLNGDITTSNNNPALFPDTYLHPAGVVDLAKGPPVFLARGNHDISGLWANKLTDYIDFPDTHENRVQRPYYAFRSGPLAALVLDSGHPRPDNTPSHRGLLSLEPLIAEQTRWIETITQRPDIKNAPIKIAFCHLPLRWPDDRAQEALADTENTDYKRVHGRNQWHAPLVKWGVRAIISGHTHRWAHIPADADYPYAQIIGGGPNPKQARLLRCHCTTKTLRITAHTMDGAESATVTI